MNTCMCHTVINASSDLTSSLTHVLSQNGRAKLFDASVTFLLHHEEGASESDRADEISESLSHTFDEEAPLCLPEQVACLASPLS